jgi:hypothetical protein
MIRPWNEIRRFYVDLSANTPGLNSMVKLVEQIEASPTLSRLYAWTTMGSLCIAQTPMGDPMDGPYLMISADPDGSVEFRYLDTMTTAKQWHRLAPGELAFSRLEGFADQLHWFARQSYPRAPTASGAT